MNDVTALKTITSKSGSAKQVVAKQVVAKPKAERTKAAILAAAENHFSRLGFAATRLEDIAEELGMTRAALFYHFRDKQTLYDATIADSFADLATQLGALVESDSFSVSEKLEQGVVAWVDAVLTRPNLARLVMRFVADGIEQPAQRVFTNNTDIPVKFFELVEEGKRSGELKPLHNDPLHAASAIIGNTVFYASALSALLPNQFEPLDPVQVAAHRDEALHSLRRLLGIDKSTIDKAQ